MPDKFDKIEASTIVADERRRYAVKAERDAVFAAIDAEAARKLRELVPDLRTQVEAQIIAAEDLEKRTRERADGARKRAGLTDGDYPSLTTEIEARIAGLEESVVRWEERADAPDLYAGHESASGVPDVAEFFRFQAANARGQLDANRAAMTATKAKRRPAADPPTQ